MNYTQDEIETLEASAIDREKLILKTDSLQKENEELRVALEEVLEVFKNQEDHHEKLEICFEDECVGCFFHKKFKALLEKDKV